MKTPITVRIEAELLSQTRQCAREENRSLTNFIETVLRRKVAEHFPAPATKTKQARAARPAKDSASHAA